MRSWVSLHERFSKFVDDLKKMRGKNRPCSRGLKKKMADVNFTRMHFGPFKKGNERLLKDGSKAGRRLISSLC